MPWKKSGMGLGQTQGGADHLEQPQETVAVLQPVFPQVLPDMLCRKEDLLSRLHGMQQHNLNAFHLIPDQDIQFWPKL
jgi:hypothetical protein